MDFIHKSIENNDDLFKNILTQVVTDGLTMIAITQSKKLTMLHGMIKGISFTTLQCIQAESSVHNASKSTKNLYNTYKLYNECMNGSKYLDEELFCASQLGGFINAELHAYKSNANASI